MRRREAAELLAILLHTRVIQPGLVAYLYFQFPVSVLFTYFIEKIFRKSFEKI